MKQRGVLVRVLSTRLVQLRTDHPTTADGRLCLRKSIVLVLVILFNIFHKWLGMNEDLKLEPATLVSTRASVLHFMITPVYEEDICQAAILYLGELLTFTPDLDQDEYRAFTKQFNRLTWTHQDLNLIMFHLFLRHAGHFEPGDMDPTPRSKLKTIMTANLVQRSKVYHYAQMACTSDENMANLYTYKQSRLFDQFYYLIKIDDNAEFAEHIQYSLVEILQLARNDQALLNKAVIDCVQVNELASSLSTLCTIGTVPTLTVGAPHAALDLISTSLNMLNELTDNLVQLLHVICDKPLYRQPDFLDDLENQARNPNLPTRM